MTQIERREARIGRIHTRNLGESKKHTVHERVAVDPSVHHCIGRSENLPEQIALFAMQADSGPMMKVI